MSIFCKPRLKCDSRTLSSEKKTNKQTNFLHHLNVNFAPHTLDFLSATFLFKLVISLLTAGRKQEKGSKMKRITLLKLHYINYYVRAQIARNFNESSRHRKKSNLKKARLLYSNISNIACKTGVFFVFACLRRCVKKLLWAPQLHLLWRFSLNSRYT